MDGGMFQPAIGQVPEVQDRAERAGRDPAMPAPRSRASTDAARPDWRDVILNDQMRIQGPSGPRPHY